VKIDVSKSVYHENDGAKDEFNRRELKHCRLLLRRLRFLEQQIRETGGLANGGGSGGAAFAEWEVEALEWILDEVGFLGEKRELLETTERNSA
jgi:hypothetical protein